MDGHLVYFHSSVVVNNAAVNVQLKISLPNIDFVSSGYIPRSGTPGWYGSFVFGFWSISILFSIMAIPFYVSTKVHSSVQSLSYVQLFVTPWTAAHQASLSHHQLLEFTQTNVHWVDDAINHLILCHPLLLLLSIFPSIRVFSNESALHIRWPKYWSFSFNISPSSEHPGLVSFRMD